MTVSSYLLAVTKYLHYRYAVCCSWERTASMIILRLGHEVLICVAESKTRQIEISYYLDPQNPHPEWAPHYLVRARLAVLEAFGAGVYYSGLVTEYSEIPDLYLDQELDSTA